VLVDVMMPGMDGWEVVRCLRGDESTRSITVTMFTATDMTVPEDILHNGGIIGIVRKPFRIQEILDILENVSKKDSVG